MKKMIIPFVIALFFCTILQAQLKDFNLSDYKRPILDRKLLQLNLNLSARQNNTRYSGDESNTLKDSDKSIANNSGISYNSYKNRDALESIQSYRVSLSPAFYNRVYNDTITNKRRDFGSYFNIQSTQRFYNKNLFFFEPDLTLNTSYSFNRLDNESEVYDSKSRIMLINVELPILVGKGRIEPVQDARLAVYILEELQKKGRLDRVPSHDEVLEFAKLISKIQNMRYFDYRLHKIYEIEQVDSFLQSKALANHADARYFTTINDNWDYASGPYRQTGKRLSVGMVPKVVYDKATQRWASPDDTIKDNYSTKTDGIRFLANFISSKPRNLYWQSDWEFEISYDFSNYRRKDNREESNLNRKVKEIRAFSEYRLSFYPNSRTSFHAGINLQVSGRMENSEFEVLNRESKYIDLISSFYLNLNYYISPQVLLTADYATNAQMRDSSQHENEVEHMHSLYSLFNQGFNVAFRYMIF